MMKRIISILTIFASLFFFAACDRENMDMFADSEGYGQIGLGSLQLNVETEVAPMSRATGIDVDNYIVGIYNVSDGALVSEWRYGDMPEIFQLKVGSYKVTAHAPNNEPSFDEPYCEGTKNIEIQKDQVTNVATLTCTLHCVAVAIKYDENFAKLMGDDAVVTVRVGGASGKAMEYNNGESRIGYFPALEGGNVVDVDFVGTIDGGKEEIKKSYASVNMGALLTVTYVLKDADGNPGTGGTINPSLNLDASCEVEEIDGTVHPGEEEGIEDFPEQGGSEGGEPENPDMNAPSVTGDGFDISKVWNTNELERVNVKLAAPLGIAHVYVDIVSDVDDFQATVNGMFEVATGESFDLAYPKAGVQKESLESLAFPVEDKIINQTLVDFDISTFVPALSGFGAGNHKFRIEVVDNDGKSAVSTLTLVVTE